MNQELTHYEGSSEASMFLTSSRYLLVLVIASLLFALSACSGGSSPSTSTGASVTPPNEPAKPSSIYTGDRREASISESNAAGIVSDFYPMALFLNNVSAHGFTVWNPGIYDETDAGDTSGSVKVQGVIKSNLTGWYEQNFTDYESSDDPGVMRQGTLTTYQPSLTQVTIGFSDYRETALGSTVRYDGTLTSTLDMNDSFISVTANVSIKSASGQILLSNFVMKMVTSPNDPHPGYVFSGRIYDSVSGFLNVTTPTPTFFGINSILEPSGTLSQETLWLINYGDVAFAGTGPMVLHLEPLNGLFNYVGLDVDGDGKIDTGSRYDLSDGSLDTVQPAGTTVSALATLASNVQAAGPVSIDGRYSYTPDGFVSYDWSLLSAPLGSNVKISGSEPTLRFTPDLPGDYLLELTVTAQGKSSIDVVQVNRPSSTQGQSATSIKVQNYIYSHVGIAVPLDARASPGLTTEFATLGAWKLIVPNGSSATLAHPDGLLATFVPDIPGIYYAYTGDEASNPAGVSIICVDEPVRLAPPAVVHEDVTIKGLNTGEFGGSGDGLVFSESSSIFIDGGEIFWSKPASSGLFGAGGDVSLTSGETGYLLAADLNIDGISDLVTPNLTNINTCPVQFRISGSGAGYSTSTVDLDSSCIAGAIVIDLARSASLNGHPAVVEADDQYGVSKLPAFAAFVQIGGAMQSPGITPVQGAAQGDLVVDFQLQDFDGDGEPDLIADVSITDTRYVQVYHGNGDGTFRFVDSYTLPSSVTPAPDHLVVGDFNGDGNQDVAVADNETLVLLYGDSTGALPRSESRSMSCVTNYLDTVDLNQDGYLDLIAGNSCNTPSGEESLDIYLSGSSTSSGGITSLGAEQIYPLPSINPDVSRSFGITEGAHGDYNGDGLTDFMLLQESPDALIFVPQVPAITSATVTSVRPPLSQLSAKEEQMSVMTPSLSKAIAGLHIFDPRW